MDRMFRAVVVAGALLLAACGNGVTGTQTVEPGAAGAYSTSAASHPETESIRSSLTSREGLLVESDNIEIRMKASNCEPFVEGLLVCEGDIQLDVSVPDIQLRQTLYPASIMLRSDALIHHGPLHVDARPEPHSFVISDVNADGREDLLLWSGREGAYGGPSFDVYLFDAGEGALRFSQPFSDLTIGYSGLFGVDGEFITTNTESGCCIHVQETHDIKANAPVLVERITTDSSEDGAPGIITERLIDGELTVIDAN